MKTIFNKKLSKAEQKEEPNMRELHARELSEPRVKTRIPWMVLGGIILGIALISGLLGWALGGGTTLFPTHTPSATFTPIATFTPSATSTPSGTFTPTITPTPIPGVGSTWISPKDGMIMMYVPAGEFSMGSEDGNDNEKPVHAVSLESYWMDQTEVTNGMFTLFVNDTDYVTDAEKSGSSWVCQNGDCQEVNGTDWAHPRGPDSSISGIEDHPVVQVSWNDAEAYCEWRGSRLPTEAEWEKAASWDDAKREKRVYPWGNTFLGSLLNFCDNNCQFPLADKSVNDGYEFTSPVGHYPEGASFYGLLDMAGNVNEWVADWNSDTYYSSSPSRNPMGPSSGDYRVLRGGSWYYNKYIARTSYRGRVGPDGRFGSFGFRCARSE